MQRAVLSGAVLILTVAALIGAAVVFFLSKDMSRQADRFFADIERGDLTHARTFLAESLRAEGGAEWLPKTLQQTGLTTVTKASWLSRSSRNGFAELNGTVTGRAGEATPVTLLFTRERLDWKVYAIRRPFTGSLPQAITPVLPDKDEQIALVKRAMHDFAVSVQSRNMSYFHSTLAPSRQEKFTTEALNQTFSNYFNIPEDLTSLDDVQPDVEVSSEKQDDGSVSLTGYFPTKPKMVRFTQKYTYEKSDWRLLSFRIAMK